MPASIRTLICCGVLYYRDAILVRQYVVDGVGKVIENRGSPLTGEADALQSDDEMKSIRQLAESLSIRTQYDETEIRMYAPTELHRGNRD